MASNKIQLTESELHDLVNEAVQQILIDEGLWDSIKGGASALGSMAKKGFKNGSGKFQNSMNNKMQQLGQGVRNVYDKASNAVANASDNIKNASRNAYDASRSVYNTVKAGAANGNIQAAKNNAIKSLNNFLQVAQKTSGVVGAQTIESVKQCIANLNRAGGRSSSVVNGRMNSTLGKFGLR